MVSLFVTLKRRTTMQKRTFNLYADPGHAWLSVKKQFLVELGIDSTVTGYSYQRGDTAYLEEDCDLSVFLAALKKVGIEADIRSHHTNRRSKIRSYASYQATPQWYRVVATVYDPRTEDGQHTAMEWSTDSRTQAVRQAEYWANTGYWSAVYDKRSGEALNDFSPKGGV